MTNELITQENPFNRAIANNGNNTGSLEIESSRAIAEAQGQLTLAKKFPRSVVSAIAEFMESCKSPDFAATAFYSVPNRGSGPSIRFAEECARVYGNFQYGHRELSRSHDKSEIEVFAWDMQNNNRSIRQITVAHVMDTKNGPRKLIDQADIDNKIANVASKQMRGRIMALMPKHMIAAGIAECKRTLAGGNEKPLRDRILAMTSAFSKFGVTPAMIEKSIGHSVDSLNVDEFADLTGVYNALREGGKVAEHFPVDAIAHEDKPAVKAIEAAAKAVTTSKPALAKTKQVDPVAAVSHPAPAPESKPQPQPEPEPQPEIEEEDLF